MTGTFSYTKRIKMQEKHRLTQQHSPNPAAEEAIPSRLYPIPARAFSLLNMIEALPPVAY